MKKRIRNSPNHLRIAYHTKNPTVSTSRDRRGSLDDSAHGDPLLSKGFYFRLHGRTGKMIGEKGAKVKEKWVAAPATVFRLDP